MQQRFLVGRRVKVSGCLCEVLVGMQQIRRNQTAPETAKSVRRQDQRGQYKGAQKHHCRRRQQPSDPPCVETLETKLSAGQLIGDEIGDQKTGNDKKNADADEPAGQKLGPGVIYHHRQNRQCA